MCMKTSGFFIPMLRGRSLELEENQMEHMPNIDMIRTGQNIIRLREEKNMSVKELQDIFGFTTPQAIYKWQQGATLPSIDNLVMLAKVFQVHIEDIIVTDEKQ